MLVNTDKNRTKISSLFPPTYNTHNLPTLQLSTQHLLLTTTSLAIAEGTGYGHATVIKLVRSHADKLEQFGPLRFEIQVANTPQGGGQPAQYAHLTEPQATLLLTFMRNNPVVIRFKVRLVEEFYRMREQLKNTQAPAQLSRMEILEMAIEAERQVEQTRQENTILRLKNEEQGTDNHLPGNR